MSQTKEIRTAVDDELSFDPLVDASDITVKNLNGDVALNGTVPNYPQYAEAAAAAKRVAGVKTVHNHRTRLMTKLDIHRNTDLVKYAIRLGMVQVD